MKCNPKRLGKIFWKRDPTEFEIQSALYSLLKSRGFNVRGEVTAKHFWNGKIRRAKLDLVVFNLKKEPAIIIETKQWGRGSLHLPPDFRRDSHQAKKYESFGLPLLFCGHIDSVQKTVDWVERNLIPTPTE